MVKYRPRRGTLSAEAKDEQTFDNLSIMFDYLCDYWNRIAKYIGSQMPVSLKDITIDGTGNVFINRSNLNICIGEYEE